MNEARLNDDVEDDDMFMEGYSRDSRRDRNREIKIYISTGIESVPIQVNISFARPIIFTCVYRPPGSEAAFSENIEALFRLLDADGETRNRNPSVINRVL